MLTCLPEIIILEIAFRFTSCPSPVEGALFPRCIDPDAFEALAPHLHLSPQEWVQVQTEKPDKTWTVTDSCKFCVPWCSQNFPEKESQSFDSSKHSLYHGNSWHLDLSVSPNIGLVLNILKSHGTSKTPLAIMEVWPAFQLPPATEASALLVLLTLAAKDRGREGWLQRPRDHKDSTQAQS